MIRYVKLYCRRCGSDNCARKPAGSWSTEEEGCLKYVSQIDGDKYFYYINEVKPNQYVLAHKGRYSPKIWKEMEEFIYSIECKPIAEIA
jgi:hypothetical protein